MPKKSDPAVQRTRSAGTAPRDTRRRGVFRILSRSAEETQEIGAALGQSLGEPSVVLLRGSLGSGKTTLARGLARGLGLQDTSHVHSPSFSLVHLYKGRGTIYHVDLYRLESERDLRSVGIEDFLGRDGATIVEWAEKLPYPVRADLEIELQDDGDDRRWILIRADRRSSNALRRGIFQRCEEE